ETRFMNAAARVVREGCGVTLIDELSAHTVLRPGLVVRAYEPALSFELTAATSRAKTTSRQTRRLITAFAEKVRAQIAEVRAEARRDPS
ncbi:LysR substrate-binding domain-containing protein, partial [Rhodovulum sulfidophilum]|nr:LysR substrate-binding domain-containing protein [Rhodovulum sulfidophilum]